VSEFKQAEQLIQGGTVMHSERQLMALGEVNGTEKIHNWGEHT
jgi:hypothetical protein